LIYLLILLIFLFEPESVVVLLAWTVCSSLINTEHSF